MMLIKKSISTTSKKKIAFRETTSRIIDVDIACLEAYSDKSFRYWETVTLQGIEREDNAPAKEWVPCNIGGNNISMAWRVYWANNEKYSEGLRGTDETSGVQCEVHTVLQPSERSCLSRLQSFYLHIFRYIFKRPQRK